MKIINASYEILTQIDNHSLIKTVEAVGRTCYKSHPLVTSDDTAANFVAALIKRGHESILEHVGVSVRIICDRGVSHQIVRHRMASYAQESTRRSRDMLRELTFIKPCFWTATSSQYETWKDAMIASEKVYFLMRDNGASAEEARTVLPSSLKTEIVQTMNLRAWRHFFALRAVGITGKPHPQMLELTIPMLKEFQRIPVIFDDLQPDFSGK